MLILLTFSVIGIGSLIYSYWERNQLKVENYRIVSAKIKKKCRFIFLTDLHEKEFGKENCILLEKIRKAEPDFILIGGDFPISHSSEETDEKDEAEVGAKLLSTLAREYPVYYSMGNHEVKLFSKKEKKGQKTLFQQAFTGVEVVDGKAVFPEKGILVAGFPLDISYYKPLFFKKKKALKDKIRASWENALSSAIRKDSPEKEEKECFTIAMLHSPFYREEALSLPVDLLLSGHFHGGAVGIPLFAFMTPQFRFFVPKPRGLFQKEEQHYFISRGLGTHTINIRINNFPELSCFDLCPKEE